MTEDLFNAAMTMTDFSYWKLPSCTLARGPHAPSFGQQPKWLAEILYSCGRCHEQRSEYNDAVRCFADAHGRFENLGNRRRVAHCACESGNIHRLLGLFGEAKAELELARDISLETNEQVYAALCMRIPWKYLQK